MILLELAILNSSLIGADSLDDENPVFLRIAFRPHGTVGHPPEDENRPETSDAPK